MKLSIITPVFNIAERLPDTIESILNQTFCDFELILVDDGSSDNSGSICDEYAQSDYRIRVIHKENGGVSSARNVGVKEASGEFIGFVDGDDQIEPNMYEELFAAQKKYEADIVQCRHNGYPVSEKTKIPPFCSEDAVLVDGPGFLRQMFAQTGDEYTNQVALWSKIYKRSCFIGVVFPEGRVYEDERETYRLCLNANKIVILSEEYYHYVKREGSIITAVSPRKIMDKQLALSDRLTEISTRVPEFTKNAAISFYGYSCFAMKELIDCEASHTNEIVKILQKQKPLFLQYLDKYQKFYCNFYSYPFLRKWIVTNDFEPIQNILRRVKLFCEKIRGR